MSEFKPIFNDDGSIVTANVRRVVDEMKERYDKEAETFKKFYPAKKWEDMTPEEKAKLKEEQSSKKVAARYNRGKLQWSMVDFKAFEPMVKVLEFGAKKYARDNWRKGLIPRQILESSLRHIFSLLQGEENDPDSGLPHIGHLMCNDMFYSYFTQVNPGAAAKDTD